MIAEKLIWKFRKDGLWSTIRATIKYPFWIAYRTIAEAPVRRKQAEMLRLGSAQERFSRIYEDNLWTSSESGSGGGSELVHTRQLRTRLPGLVADHGIRKIVDAPCGDLNWMKLVLPALDVEYVGLDIVPSVIERNRVEFGSERATFAVADLGNDPIPSCDLVIARDFLFHLSFADIDAYLRNLAKCDYRYVLTTTHIVGDGFANSDIETGDFRRIDLFRARFGIDPAAPVEEFDDYPQGHPMPRKMILLRKEDMPTSLSL